ncbi:MAG: two-component regulator propeller domain-containing protein, partial [Bacteroidota bacterium]|nr:two-component regulator propeller domain-containing protein [Bacteroidota bacterium]
LIILTDPTLGGYPGSAMVLLYDPATGRLTIPETAAEAFSIARSPHGEIMIATSRGVRRLDTLALRHDSVRLEEPDFPYRAADHIISNYLYFDRSGNFWLVADNGITEIDRTGKSNLFNMANGMPPGTNNSVFQDRENNMWFTNAQNGVTKLASREVEFYPSPSPGFVTTDIYSDGQHDSTWFYDGLAHTLLLVTGNSRQYFHGTGDLPGLGQIAIRNSRQAYMIHDYGLYALHFLPGGKYSASLLSRSPPDPRDTQPSDYASAGFDARGDLVLTASKLEILTSGRLHRAPLPYRSDQAAVDRYNRIWVAMRSNRLSVYGRSDSDTALRLLQTWTQELPRVSPRSIAVDREGRVWVGTRDYGLFCLLFDGLKLRSWKQLTVKNGLSENFVSYLQCDPDNTVWACTPSGLDRVRFEDGRLVLDNVTRSNAAYQSVYKIVPGGPGIHWALVQGGIIRIGRTPGRPSDYLPSVLFSEVLAGNEPVSRSGGVVRLPYDRNSISVFVGASSFIDETQTRYSYLLEGSSDARWTDPSSESSIHLIDLPPGRYTLKVKAQFLTGHYRDQEGDYTFIILPPWWQTWWFRVLTICALAGLGILWTRSYVRRRLEKQRIALEKRQAIEKERTRIATDMHDDLGAGLSRIKFLSETIGIRQQQQQSIEEEITGIRQYSNEMIDKMGEIVWALNEKNDSLSDLLSYTRSYAVEYLMQAGLACEAAPPDTVPSLHVNGEFRRNVYLTVKEALHNIVKHARADKVIISMEASRQLVISISDDGIGFDKSHIRPFSNGLANMEKRIREIGGELSILHGDSGKSPGTTVRLTVRLPASI